MLVQSLIGSCLWLWALKNSGSDLYFVFCEVSNEVETKNIMKQSRCYTGKSVWRDFCHLVAVSSYRNDSLCCGDIWCSQPCMTSWGFENKDSLGFLNLGFLKLASSDLLDSACFPQQGFVLGFSLFFLGGVLWWVYLVGFLLVFFLLCGERKVGWLFINFERVWMFAEFADAIREEGNKWYKTLSLPFWLEGKKCHCPF